MTHNNMTVCSCPVITLTVGPYYEILCKTLATLATSGNAIILLIFALRGGRQRSTNENLILALIRCDFAMPLIFLISYVGAFFKNDLINFFITLVCSMYLWRVLYTISILLMLLLAIRRYIAIEQPLVYPTRCDEENTTKLCHLIYVFSAVFFLPILFYRPDTNADAPVGNDRRGPCKDQPSGEPVYSGSIVVMVYPQGYYFFAITFWAYVFLVQLASPIILSFLSFKFMRTLQKADANRKIISSSNVSFANRQKIKLILILSLMVLVRELPLGSLSLYFIFFSPSAVCLVKVRNISTNTALLASSTNFMVLFWTNRKFKELCFFACGWKTATVSPECVAS